MTSPSSARSACVALSSAALPGLLALCACDPQASTAYNGESLLRVRGSVELTLDREYDGALQPALAFRNSEQNAFYIMDVAVRGEFPASFTLDVYEPPPDEAFIVANPHFPDEPQAAIGYITAVTDDRPDMIRFGDMWPSVGASGCAPGPGTPPCEFTLWEQWCAGNDDECYVEETRCPYMDAPREECTVTSTGDPALKQDRWESFAGLSQNYIVLYLREPAAPRSWIASVLGARDGGLDAGYHLLAVAEPTDAQAREREACHEEAAIAATERYNEAHGTDFTWDDFEVEHCSGYFVCDTDGTCEGESLDCDYEAWGVIVAQVEVELGCRLSEIVVTPIADPAAERITVRIGDDIEPLE